MKKLITKILSLAITVVLFASVFTGCSLITTNVANDMNQVVATVAIDSDFNDVIYKKDMQSSYNQYAYTYMYYYGYTSDKVYELVLDNLVQNRIIVQQSKKALTGATGLPGNETGYFSQASQIAEGDRTAKEKALMLVENPTAVTKTSELVKFLTAYEVVSAKYSVLNSVRSLLDGYGDEEEDDKSYDYEKYSVTDRKTLTLPSETSGNEWEIKNDAELSVVTDSYKKSIKKIAKDNGIEFDYDAYTTKFDISNKLYTDYVANFDLTSKESKKELKKLFKDLLKNGFITEKEAKNIPTTVDELFAVSFFKSTLDSQYEGLIVSKYKLALQNQQEKEINKDSVLYSSYRSLFESQKDLYSLDYKAYETALNSTDNFIVYNPDSTKGNYGFVLNLLIGFNDEQTSIIESLATEKALTKQEIVDDLTNGILKQLTAKDQRTTWVYSNHGKYDENTKKFTFGNDYCKTNALQEFVGAIYGANEYTYLDEDEEEATAYSYANVVAKEIPFNEFYTNYVESVMGFAGMDGQLSDASEDTVINTSTVTQKTIKEELLEKFRDLVYAFSTDPGSLAENYGYLYSPITSSTQYVKPYADAAKELVNLGVGAYKVVATEFGYHIMLCTSVIMPTVSTVPMDETTFVNDLQNENTVAYKYKEFKMNSIATTTVENITNAFINDNLEKVVYNKKAYKDLIKED